MTLSLEDDVRLGLETAPDFAPRLDPVQSFLDLRQRIGRIPGPVPVEKLKFVHQAQGTGHHIQMSCFLQSAEQVPGEGILAVFAGQIRPTRHAGIGPKETTTGLPE